MIFTHTFTESLAQRALSGLSETSGKIPTTDGTVKGLRKIMTENNISEFLVLPVATKPSQQTAINNWASEIMGNGLYACGTIHPDADNAFEEIDRIKSLGLYGVKFHSEYQHFCPDEERMFPIYEKIAENGLIAVFHGGWDPFGDGEIRCTPERMARAVARVPQLTFVTAHLGGINVWDDVEKYLAGKFDNLYLDVSVIASFGISDNQLLRIIRTHGTDKILFGSDCPWDNPTNELNMIHRLPLDEEDMEKIFFRNAHRILKLPKYI
ncbi:MAG: amidohydrolase family protein [Ruminococcus flavefaciens]|nr:amidohydrolase family protein [Ruminococcus flavefaciens]